MTTKFRYKLFLSGIVSDSLESYSVLAQKVFNIFCFLADERIKLKILAFSFKNPSRTRFKDPEAAILTLKMLTGSRL